ncbi:XRCC4-like factor-domain-containing protein [Aspergillus karnatakaensis]|uniref:uncharacterized protein n=1 Tax=Aspergillus karnatakaensis TaxID=1810916 RepID=UPI003CCD903B
MPAKWQRLHLFNEGDIPPLLFRYSPTANSYELHLTDLNYIWSENLDRKAIFKRADDDETTIDPSEDLEQFKVLLQKIGDGLRNEPGSKLVLNPAKRGDGQDLELTLTVKLPAPLEPLRWTIHLFKQPQYFTTSNLLLPFIKAEAGQEARQKSLIEELSKKDWVLQKLFDKIEAMGIDLSAIFPGTSGLRGGRKGLTLAQAAKYIKGLAPFDEQSWREQVDKASPDSGLAANIVAELSNASQASEQLESLKPPTNGWWNCVRIVDSRMSPSVPQDKHEKKSGKTSREAMEIDSTAGTETDDDDDDEFERQETPPGLKKPNKGGSQHTQAISKHQGETQSEDEEASPPPRKRVKESQTDPPSPAIRPKAPPARAGAGKARGLGTIGGKKQPKPTKPSPSPSPSPSPPPVPKSPSQHSLKEQQSPPPGLDRNDETTDDEDIDSYQPTSEPKPAPKPVPKKTGLHVIGGKKKKQSTPTPEPESRHKPESGAETGQSQSTPQSTDRSTKNKKPLGKIGRIGGQRAKLKPNTGTRPSQSISPPPNSKSEPKHADDTETDDGEEEEGMMKNKKKASTPLYPKDKKPKFEPSPPPAREETEEEKADRKREELKRLLEAKSKAPVKKKRRF